MESAAAQVATPGQLKRLGAAASSRPISTWPSLQVWGPVQGIQLGASAGKLTMACAVHHHPQARAHRPNAAKHGRSWDLQAAGLQSGGSPPGVCFTSSSGLKVRGGRALLPADRSSSANKRGRTWFHGKRGQAVGPAVQDFHMMATTSCTAAASGSAPAATFVSAPYLHARLLQQLRAVLLEPLARLLAALQAILTQLAALFQAGVHAATNSEWWQALPAAAVNTTAAARDALGATTSTALTTTTHAASALCTHAGAALQATADVAAAAPAASATAAATTMASYRSQLAARGRCVAETVAAHCPPQLTACLSSWTPAQQLAAVGVLAAALLMPGWLRDYWLGLEKQREYDELLESNARSLVLQKQVCCVLWWEGGGGLRVVYRLHAAKMHSVCAFELPACDVYSCRVFTNMHASHWR